MVFHLSMPYFFLVIKVSTSLGVLVAMFKTGQGRKDGAVSKPLNYRVLDPATRERLGGHGLPLKSSFLVFLLSRFFWDPRVAKRQQ